MREPVQYVRVGENRLPLDMGAALIDYAKLPKYRCKNPRCRTVLFRGDLAEGTAVEIKCHCGTLQAFGDGGDSSKFEGHRCCGKKCKRLLFRGRIAKGTRISIVCQGDKTINRIVTL